MRYFFILFLLLLCACGSKPKTNHIISEQTVIDSLKLIDAPLSQPQPGDWLFNNPEKGQTFEQYKNFTPLAPDAKHSIFYLQPLGSFTPKESKIILSLVEFLEAFYSIKVKVLENLSDEIINGETIRFSSTGNHQILTHYVIDSVLAPRMPDSAFIYMCITNRDLYTGEKNNFVFGQATYKRRLAVSSMQRFLDDPEKLLVRTIKTATHETGHMLGIKHCTYAICLMNGCNNIDELDRRPCHLCSECTKKIYWSLKFNLKDRYHQLKEVYQKYNMQEEVEFTKKSEKVLGL